MITQNFVNSQAAAAASSEQRFVWLYAHYFSMYNELFIGTKLYKTFGRSFFQPLNLPACSVRCILERLELNLKPEVIVVSSSNTVIP